MDVRFTATGRAQYLAAIGSIRRNSPQAARLVQRRAEQALKRLRRFPMSGAIVTEFEWPDYRELYVKPYRFFYQVREKTVLIAAVWHGAQVPGEPEDMGGNGKE
jgi:addiction module RelE/StbE family toxin